MDQTSNSPLRRWTIRMRQNPDWTFTVTCLELGLSFTRLTPKQADEALLDAMAKMIGQALLAAWSAARN